MESYILETPIAVIVTIVTLKTNQQLNENGGEMKDHNSPTEPLQRQPETGWEFGSLGICIRTVNEECYDYHVYYIIGVDPIRDTHMHCVVRENFSLPSVEKQKGRFCINKWVSTKSSS